MEGPVLVLGAAGQVGSALMERLDEDAIGLTQAEADLSNPDTLPDILAKHSPAAVINAAAYTAVDKAEEEEALAQVINGEAPGVIAKWCAQHGIPLVHYSTDYVFPGDGESPWKEEDVTGPLNAYGHTKLAGEEAIAAAGGKYLIFRTSWVYAEEGHNFVNTMLRLAGEREELSIVSDQVGAPTYAGDIAEYSLQALHQAAGMEVFPSGIYHLTNAGETNWCEFAENIFDTATGLGAELVITAVKPIATADYPTPATRPLNSRLDGSTLQRVFGITLSEWQDGLSRCLAKKFANEEIREQAI